MNKQKQRQKQAKQKKDKAKTNIRKIQEKQNIRLHEKMSN